MYFYLGTTKSHWLWKVPVELFISNRTLSKTKKLQPSIKNWALDSGGFSELSMYGEWKTTAKEYVNDVRRYVSEIGNMDWATIQDWMCEPFITEKTGLSVLEHQARTLNSYKELNSLAPEINWLPVIQGYKLEDYLNHVDMYDRAGIDLRKFKLVGVGSVCRRQRTEEIGDIIWTLTTKQKLKLHGFGVKISGLKNMRRLLRSADSLAWSYAASFDPPLPGCTHNHCTDCDKYAMLWRNKVLGYLGEFCEQELIEVQEQ